MIEAAIGASRTSRQRGDQAERRVVVVAEPEQHVGEVGDRGADRRGDRLDQDVAVADVRELVGEDAAQLVLGEQFGDPAGDRDRGVLGVAAGGEGVGLVLGDHVEARHRQPGAGRQFADDLVEARRFRLLDRLRPAHLQRQFVAEEVGAEVDQQGDAEEEGGGAGAADQGADHDQQARRGTPAGSSCGGWRRRWTAWWSSSIRSWSDGWPAEVLPGGRAIGHRWQPLFAPLGCPGGIGGSTLARCDRGGTAEHDRDRRAGRRSRWRSPPP